MGNRHKRVKESQMPAPGTDFIAGPLVPPVRVALEPAHNAIYSLLLLTKAVSMTSENEWAARANAALTPEQRHTNRLVLFGLHYAVVPQQSWPSFPAYLARLASQAPTVLRDRVFDSYARLPKQNPPAEQPPLDVAPLLASVDAFLEFLAERFPPEIIDPELETEAHTYLKNPPAMQNLIVTHLQEMWDNLLRVEWEQNLPALQACVDAFGRLDLASMPRWQAAQLALGKELDEKWKKGIEQAEQLIFVPSAHIGSYFGRFKAHKTLWVLFGARQLHTADLSRAEILSRVNALADDTRLRILKLAAEQGEQSSHDIQVHVGLGQSAVSRHLKQLSATGYLDERRRAGAKHYTLNSGRVRQTLRAISTFLLGK
jgi:DNA-binding transcriptional ArsR family regulator